MSYQINIEYSMENLILKISDDYQSKIDKTKDIFSAIAASPIFVIQTDGIKSYLKYRLSERFGILLNIKTFDLQSLFSEYSKAFLQNISKKIETNFDELEETKVDSKNKIFWFLYSYFYSIAKRKNVEFSQQFQNFTIFLSTFSDLFEQYETYRDFENWDILKNENLNEVDYKYIENFINHIESKEIYSEKFQVELIKLILNSDSINTKFKIFHKIKSLKGKEDIIQKIPKNPIFIIGFDNIPYFYFLFLKFLSQYVDINFYFLLPSSIEQYNAKLNELKELTLFDEAKLYTRSTLLKLCFERQQKFFNDFLNYFPINHHFGTFELNRLEKPNLLNLYQNFISSPYSANNLRSDRPTKIKIDDSIQILSNYTPLRELEVIKDKILELLSKNKDYKYEDIVIMAVDIDKYRPFIDSVFKLTNPVMPVLVVDLDSSKYSKIFELIQLFFDLISNNFKKKDFNSFISHELIMQKFELSFTDIEVFTNLFTNYLWGADYVDIQAYFEKVLNHDTYEKDKKGEIEKVDEQIADIDISNLAFDYNIESNFISNFIGFMGANSYYEKESFIKFKNRILPIKSEIEGEFLDKIQKIYSIYISLIDLYKFSKISATASSYKDFIENFFENLVIDSEQYHDEIIFYRNRILNFLDEIAQANAGKNDIIINFETFKNLLLNYLKSYPYSLGYKTGAILFSSMVSLRNIPAKAIAVLGLNDSEFPRNSVNFSFDLMAKKEESWDRNIRESDKYLFLETVLSSKDYLILSYLGKDPVNNKEKAPSILIEIMKQDINSNFSFETNLEIIQMPLQPFSKKYYFDGIFKTYNIYWKNFYENLFSSSIDQLMNQKEEINKEIENKEREEEIFKKGDKDIIIDKNNSLDNKIDLDDFLSFLVNPSKHYLQKVINIKTSFYDDSIDDEFNYYVNDIKIENIFIKLLEFKLKEKLNIEISEIDKEYLEFYKNVFLGYRGIITDIDYKFFENVSNFYCELIFEKINSISSNKDENVKSIKIDKNYRIIDLNGKFKIKYSFYEIKFDDKLKLVFKLDKKLDNSGNKFPLNLKTKILNYLTINFSESKDFANQFIELKRKKSGYKDFDFDIYIMQNQENEKTDKIESNIVLQSIEKLLDLYDKVIIKKNFIPIIGYKMDKILNKYSCKESLINYWQNNLYSFDQDQGKLNISKIYSSWIFDRYINSESFEKLYFESIVNFFNQLKILKEIFEEKDDNKTKK